MRRGVKVSAILIVAVLLMAGYCVVDGFLQRKTILQFHSKLMLGETLSVSEARAAQRLGLWTGLTSADVKRLLGESTVTGKFRDADMRYVLGPSSGFPIDQEWLLMTMSQDRVNKAWLAED